MNPQFHIQIPRTGGAAKCHVVVSVTQQYDTNPSGPATAAAAAAGNSNRTSGTAERKRKRKRKLHHIGFAVYEVPPHMTRLTPLYVAEHVSNLTILTVIK